MQSVYNRLSKKNDLKGAYGIKNIHEMLAELSNPQFRTLVKEGGFWKVLLNAIKRMLGFEGTYNAELAELDNILSSFLENYNEEAYMDAVESIYGEDIFTTIEEVDAKEGDAYSDVMYSIREKDAKTLDMLNNGETIKVYRAMQVIDGKLYPPMSAKVDGKMREPIELGVWERAEERPDLADAKGYFKLDKGNKSSLKARYNPYIHTSLTPLNDQFSSAQDRPNLVTVEVEIPASELTSGYKAEKAKDAVGKLEWKAGVVQSQLSGTRTVILSRWDRPLRIVPDSEVAQRIVEMFGDKEVVMPSNVVTPSLRAELEKLGVPFKETDNQGKEVKYSVKDKRKSAITTESAQYEHHPSVVVIADDTKVLKNIDSTIDKYENVKRANAFLGDLANAIGAKKRGGKSQYATFEAMNGKVFTIRLSDHNATIKNFDDHNEKEGISIVITTGQNPGVNLGGDAHLVEFFYDAIKLRKAEGYPLVDILKSIKQALYSGEYKDTTGLAQVEEVNKPSYSLREATGEKLTPAMIRHHMMENVTRHHEQEVNRINRFYDREERQAKALILLPSSGSYCHSTNSRWRGMHLGSPRSPLTM